MKELDLILEAFVNDQSKNLVGGGWPELEQFLATEDDQLWDWIQNPGVAPTRFQPLLAAMRRRE